MNRLLSLAVLLPISVLAEGSVCERDGLTVRLDECQKCDCRMKLAPDGRSATVNLARLNGVAPEKMVERAFACLKVGREPAKVKRPLMGWSSWNTFALNISESLILETARAMATNGLKAAGYTYVNIDDGFFCGHDKTGRLLIHPERFPNGLKPVVDGIHALGLKAGIYSDAGADTCGSMWSEDALGKGAGLYGHDASDLKFHFNDMGFDFIKVDYCGGLRLMLDERRRYTEIAAALRATGREDARLNVCRWAYPGTWISQIAESWRTTYDIRASWKSVKKLIGENLYLSAYASPGHYNDLDMLEVGRPFGAASSETFKEDVGLTSEEEATHFGMWCMLSSPLLIGCDVRSIPASSLKLVTNRSLLSMSQNDLGCQGYVVARDGDACVLVKDALKLGGPSRFVALYNAKDEPHSFRVSSASLDLAGEIAVLDLVREADIGAFKDEFSVTVPAHATRFYRFDAAERLDRALYEAETAFLSDYQELVDAKQAGTAYPTEMPKASGGVAVVNLGGRASNDLIWQDVRVSTAGDYQLVLAYAAEAASSIFVQIDGARPVELKVAPTAGSFAELAYAVKFAAGSHVVRLCNRQAKLPTIDFMKVVKR